MSSTLLPSVCSLISGPRRVSQRQLEDQTFLTDFPLVRCWGVSFFPLFSCCPPSCLSSYSSLSACSIPSCCFDSFNGRYLRAKRDDKMRQGNWCILQPFIEPFQIIVIKASTMIIFFHSRDDQKAPVCDAKLTFTIIQLWFICPLNSKWTDPLYHGFLVFTTPRSALHCRHKPHWPIHPSSYCGGGGHPTESICSANMSGSAQVVLQHLARGGLHWIKFESESLKVQTHSFVRLARWAHSTFTGVDPLIRGEDL